MKQAFPQKRWLFLIVIFLAGCQPVPTLVIPAVTATDVPRPTLTVVPTFTMTPTNTPSLPTVTVTPVPPTATLAVSLTQTTVLMDNGLRWTECAVPNRDYAMVRDDMDFLAKCVEPPELASADDQKMVGERVENQPSFSDFKITIGEDHFETKVAGSQGCCTYQLIKNGTVLLKISTQFTTYDPNLGLWNIGGHLVWELGGMTSVLIVDGVNCNDQYHLQGSYKPYEINGKLIYIAKKNEKLQVIYNGQSIGPEFDEISMPNCCAMVYLFRGNGRYWFVGSHDGTKVVVSIEKS